MRIIKGLVLAGLMASGMALTTIAWAGDEQGWNADQIANHKLVRKLEAVRIKAHSQNAARTGDILTISVAGKPVASFTDQGVGQCQGFDSCSVWTFDGVVTLRPDGIRPITYAEISHDNGEIDQSILVGPDGRMTWFDAVPVPSPRGDYVATGNSEEGPIDGFLELTTWVNGARVNFDLNVACDPVTWLSQTVLVLRCATPDMEHHTRATFTRITPALWRFQETGEVEAKEGSLKPLVRSKLKLRALDAKPVMEKPVSAKDKAEAETFDRNIGYLRLAKP